MSWPKQNDKLVKKGRSQNLNVEFSKGSPNERAVLMIRGYKNAADILVEHANRSHFDTVTLVFPIVYNYRHSIELYMKFLIEEFGPGAGVSPLRDEHNLQTIWKELNIIANHYKNTVSEEEAQEIEKTDKVMTSLCGQFASFDTDGTAFRYPANKHGVSKQYKTSNFDLAHFREQVEKMHAYFCGCAGYWGELENQY